MATRIKWNDFWKQNLAGSLDAEIKAATGIDLRKNIEMRRRRNVMLNRVGLLPKFIATDFGPIPLKNWRAGRIA